MTGCCISCDVSLSENYGKKVCIACIEDIKVFNSILRTREIQSDDFKHQCF